jgi:tetratricopeptide (TPR) repeat protein
MIATNYIMNKKILFSFIFIFFYFLTFSQNTTIETNAKRVKINKLINEVNSNPSDTAKVRLYFILASRFEEINADSSLIFAKKAYALAKNIGYEFGIANTAIDLGNRSLQIGIYNDALNKFFESYDIGISLKDTILITTALDNICTTYQLLQDHNNRVIYAKKSILIAQKISEITKSESILKDAYRQIGGAFLLLKKYDSALFYYNSVNQISLKYNDTDDLIVSYMLLGEFNQTVKNYSISIEYYKKALALYKEDETSNILKFQLYNYIGNVYFSQNDLKNSYYYNSLAFKESEKSGWVQGIESTSKSLLEYFKKINKYDSAYKYLDLYTRLKDSTSNIDKVRLIDNFSFEKKNAERELQEQKYNEEQLRSKNIKLGLIAIFIPTFAAFVFFLRSRSKGNTKILTTLGVTSLLMVFEFISLLIHPIVEKKSHHDPIVMYIVLMLVASILVPLHHKLESYIKKKIK